MSLYIYIPKALNVQVLLDQLQNNTARTRWTKVAEVHDTSCLIICDPVILTKNCGGNISLRLWLCGAKEDCGA